MAANSKDKFLPYMQVTYDVDYSRPQSITTKSPIFDRLRSGHIIASQKSHATGCCLSYESQEEYNEATSASLSVDVNFGAFKASGSMSTQSSRSRKKKMFRFDQRVITEQYEVQLNMTALIKPQKILGEDIIALINDEDFEMEDFTSICGPFIATKVVLGGIMENTVFVEQDGRTSKDQVEAKLSASYGCLFGGASASASGSSSSASWNNNVRITQQFHCEGGNTSIWLDYDGPGEGKQEGNYEKIRKKWTDSIDDGNLYPVRVTLMPIWRVLKKINKGRAAEIEKYWLSKWRKEGKSLEIFASNFKCDHDVEVSGAGWDEANGFYKESGTCIGLPRYAKVDNNGVEVAQLYNVMGWKILTNKKNGEMNYAYVTPHEPDGTPYEAKRLENHTKPEAWSIESHTPGPAPSLYFPSCAAEEQWWKELVPSDKQKIIDMVSQAAQHYGREWGEGVINDLRVKFGLTPLQINVMPIVLGLRGYIEGTPSVLRPS